MKISNFLKPRGNLEDYFIVIASLIIISHLLPAILTRITPLGYYYKLNSIGLSQSEYNTCEPIKINIDKTSKFTGSIKVALAISSYDDEDLYEVLSFEPPNFIGNKKFSQVIDLGCLKEGRWNVTGTLSFYINNTQRIQSFNVGTFVINSKDI